MRCLYCGNELALLKKLTGYGEFCSEAHRQKYQEQYNRLALTRLLQAQGSQPDRRPLQMSARPGPRQRNELNAGPERRQLEASEPSYTKVPKEPECPDLRGFMPHQFEPALSPCELFSTEPFLAPVTACLPGSGVRPVASTPGTATGSEPPPPMPSGGEPKAANGGNGGRGLSLLNGSHPVPLSLHRAISQPISDGNAISYPFVTEFSDTIASLLNPLLAAVEPGTEALRALPAAVNGKNGTHRVFPPPEITPERADPEPPAEVAVAEPPVGEHPVQVSEADTLLFEGEAPAPSAGPPVVIDLDVLGIEKEPARPPLSGGVQPVSVVVSDSPEARRLLGILFGEEEPATPVETPPAETAPPAEPVPVIAEAAAPVDSDLRAAPIGQKDITQTPETAGEAELAIEAAAPEAPILLEFPVVEGPGAPDARSITEPTPETAVESAPEPEPDLIPAVVDHFVDVRLRLADDAFSPINDAEFATPEFAIETPPVVTGPLRPKVLFGPSPEVPAPVPEEPRVESESLGSEPAIEEGPRAGAAGAGTAPHPGISDRAAERPRPARRLEDQVSPPDSAPPIAGPAQTAARLRSMAALARKAQQEAATRDTAEPARTGPEAVTAPPAPVQDPAPPHAEKPGMDLEALRLELEQLGSAGAAPSVRTRRIAVAIALVLALVLVGYLLREAFAAKPEIRQPQSRLEVFGPSLVSGEDGWSLDWASNTANAFPGRQIYIFRPSLTMSDYRIEFQGQIESKGLGWIFRAANPRNYYAIKLEMAKAGLSPTVVMSRTAVINGEETQRSQAELPIPVTLETVYKVRTDVWGTTFKTYIQEQLVDTWVDDRLKSGGFGLLRDKDEVARVTLIQLHGLRMVTP